MITNLEFEHHSSRDVIFDISVEQGWDTRESGDHLCLWSGRILVLFVNTEWWYCAVVPRVSLDKLDLKLTAFFTLYLNGLIFVWTWKYAEAIFRPSSCTCCSSLVFCHHGGCGPRDSAGMAPDGSGRGEGHAADRPGTAVYVTADVRQCGQSVWKVIPHLDQ